MAVHIECSTAAGHLAEASCVQEVKEQQLMKSQIGVIRLQIDQLAQQVAEFDVFFQHHVLNPNINNQLSKTHVTHAKDCVHLLDCREQLLSQGLTCYHSTV